MERRKVARNRPAPALPGQSGGRTARKGGAHLMTPRAAPAGAFGWPEVHFYEH